MGIVYKRKEYPIMTYEEILECAHEDLARGWKSVEDIRSEFIYLMEGGGLKRETAEREFNKLVMLAKYEGKYISLVPQCDEWGRETSMKMLSIDGLTTYANLIIDEDCRNDVWHVYQYPEFEEDDSSSLRFIGDLEVVYHGPVWPILRTYDEDETNAALAAMLDESDKAWSI
jgi:hypothetical protein